MGPVERHVGRFDCELAEGRRRRGRRIGSRSKASSEADASGKGLFGWQGQGLEGKTVFGIRMETTGVDDAGECGGRDGCAQRRQLLQVYNDVKDWLMAQALALLKSDKESTFGDEDLACCCCSECW